MEKFKDYKENQEISENDIDLEKEANIENKEFIMQESQEQLIKLQEEYEENKENLIEEKKQIIEEIYQESYLEKNKTDLLDNKNKILEGQENIEDENISIDDLNNQLSSYQTYAYNLLISKVNLTSLYKEQEQNFFVKRYPFSHPEKTKLTKIMSEILENEKNIQDIQNKISELEKKLVSEILKKRDYATEMKSLYAKIYSDEFNEKTQKLEENINLSRKQFTDFQRDSTTKFKSTEEKLSYKKEYLLRATLIREQMREYKKEKANNEIHNSLAYLNQDIFNYFEDIDILNQNFDPSTDLTVFDDNFKGYFDLSNKKMNYYFETEEIKNGFMSKLYQYYINDIKKYSEYKCGTMVKYGISDKYINKFTMISNKITNYNLIKEFEKRKSAEELENQKLIDEAEEIKMEVLEDSGKLTLSREDFYKYFDKDSFEFGAKLKQSNVGDCYLIAAMYSMSKSAQFEIMVRSSIKRNSDGTWEVKIPLMSNNTETIKIYPNELKSQINKNLGQDLSWNKRVKDYRIYLKPVNSKQGFQVLEAAYMKKKFGEVDRLKVEGGFGSEVLGVFSQENISTSQIPLNENGEFNKKQIDYTINNFNKNMDLVGFNTYHNKGNYKDKGYKTYKVGKNTFYGGHAYSLDSVDKENKIIRVVNPWNTSKKIEIKFEDIGKAFAVMELGNIQMDKFLSNLQKIQ